MMVRISSLLKIEGRVLRVGILTHLAAHNPGLLKKLLYLLKD